MQLNYSKKEIIHKIRNLLLVVLGTAILAFGTGIFIIPYNLVTGGVSGLGIVVKKMLPFDFSIDFYVSILTWILFFIGWIFLGKSFALKTLISTIVYPLVLSLSMLLVNPNVLNGFFYLEGSPYQDISILLASIFGAILVGSGCAITFIGGGSTGGVDVIAFLICKIFKRLKSSIIIFIIDALIVVMGMLIIHDLVISLLGIVSAFICALVVDKVFLGNSRAYVAHIISSQYELINEEVIKRLDRTTTILDVIGGYTKEEKKMIMISFTINQYSELVNIINIYDRKAFITISRAHEINGEGWTYEGINEVKK